MAGLGLYGSFKNVNKSETAVRARVQRCLSDKAGAQIIVLYPVAVLFTLFHQSYSAGSIYSASTAMHS